MNEEYSAESNSDDYEKSNASDYDKSLDDKRAFRYCIHLIAKQDYSIFKLSRKLKSKNYQQSVVDICIDKLQELGYLQENEYKRARVLGIAKKGYGVRYIKQKCQEEKLEATEQYIYELLEENELDEFEILLYQVEKKIRNLDFTLMDNDQRWKETQKIKRQLIARGFEFQDVSNAIVNKLGY